MMHRTLTLLALVAAAFAAQAESAGETRWRADIPNAFVRLERAWAAYQLKATSAQYDIGDIVVAAAAPAQLVEVFNPYRLQPTQRADRTFSLAGSLETTSTVCVDGILKSSEELKGFLRGMRQAKASLATSDCQPGALNSAVSFPAHVYARKVVTAERAAQIIAIDKAERAAQVAVADTIQFALPAGRLLNFAGLLNQTTAYETTTLSNSSAELWAASAVVTDGPFVATLAGCDAVGPTGSCLLSVSFKPTVAGRVTGHVSVTTSTGKVLILRLAGVGKA